MTTAPYLKLILMRHAESWGNRLGQMEGQSTGQSSTPLTLQGCEQAQKLRHALHQGDSPSICYVSPALRTLQTAAILCAPAVDRPIPPLVTEAALQEVHPGIFQGLTWSEAMARYPDLCQQLCSQLNLVPIPQAESPIAARQRATDWLTQCLQHHQAGESVWVVSHGGLLQHLVAVVLGCDRTWQIQIPNTARFEFWLALPSNSTGNSATEADPDVLNPERWKIKRFNQLP